jgi:hypothetical protein
MGGDASGFRHFRGIGGRAGLTRDQLRVIHRAHGGAVSAAMGKVDGTTLKR